MPRLGGRRRFKIKTWMLFVALIILLFGDATMMRSDHLKMTELRDAVLAADQAEDDEAILAATDDLREFMKSNMVVNIVEDNGVQKITFGTGPFYLERQYVRAATKALKEAEDNVKPDENPNGNIYGMAGQVCRKEAISHGWNWDNVNYINCMLSEIQKYPAADELQTQMIASLPSTELYRREYASPIWAPTLTGFMVLITLIIALVIVVRFIIWIVLKISLLFG